MYTSEDTAMLSALKQDNRLDAYQYFFTKYYEPLFIKAYEMLGNVQIAKDTIRQIFVEVWKTKAYKDIELSAAGFFYQLVYKRCSQLQKDTAAAAAERYKTQCPPCKTGPALVPQALHPQLIVAMDYVQKRNLTLNQS